MPKQTIEIDVPDGFEIAILKQYRGDSSECKVPEHIEFIDEHIEYRLRRKPHPFIEVREYLVYYPGIGYTTESINKSGSYYGPCEVENMPNFIKWIDHEWRKVEI